MDNKSGYSEESKDYIEKKVKNSEQDKRRYERSKEREKQHNKNWSKTKVNLNDIISKFVPNILKQYTESGVKYCWEGEKYKVIADKVAGYLRIYDKGLKRFVKLDGTPGSNEETHFKIMKKEEM